MDHRVKATYEHGTLILDEPLDVSDGSTLDIVILDSSPEKNEGSARFVARRMAEIASLPLEGNGEPFSNRDHDRILYRK